ncbi:MAG: DUF1801 domain-containing protein [Bacteroidota bacterium]
MGKTVFKQHPAVAFKWAAYPEVVRSKLKVLQQLIVEVAESLPEIQQIEETLKWGEPSYIVQRGSTIRMDWKPKTPQQYALYFNCNTRLVETFKVVYGDLFNYEGKRAILFDLEDEIPKEEIKACIQMALQYQALKNQPLLGK